MNRSKKIRKRLELRRALYGEMILAMNVKLRDGFHKPGSQNGRKR